MNQNNEYIASIQAESLKVFADAVYTEILKKIGPKARIFKAAETQVNSYLIKFDTVDEFSLTLFGSDTLNQDMLQVIISYGKDFNDYNMSDKRDTEQFTQSLCDHVLSLVGKKIKIANIDKPHKGSYTVYSYLDDGGNWRPMFENERLGGLPAKLFIWKKQEAEQIFDLRFNN